MLSVGLKLLCLWDFPGKSTGVGCLSLLQGIFPTQGSNPGLLHCGQILYPLSHEGSANTGQSSRSFLQGSLRDQRIEPWSLAMQADSLPAEPPGTWGPLPSGAWLAPWERRRVSRLPTRLDMERDQSKWLRLGRSAWACWHGVSGASQGQQARLWRCLGGWEPRLSRQPRQSFSSCLGAAWKSVLSVE